MASALRQSYVYTVIVRRPQGRTCAKRETPRMQRIDRKGLRAPARVLDLELASVDPVDEDALAVEQYNAVWCLSRVDGAPQEISFWNVTEDASVSVRDLRDQLRIERTSDLRMSPEPPPPNTANLDVTVVICTRDRPVGLRATLASLQRQTDSDFGVLVVDNGSSSPESARVVEDLGLARCEYVVEPRPGLARARNRALGAVHTDFVAWIDDDEVADPNWVRRLKEGFAHEAKPAAVCGVMLPAELEFEAQVRFEQYGGFNKGRGMAPEVLRMGTSSVISPLYPLPAFGPGGNMAFQTESLRSVEGFDPCLGAGTRTHGCEETRVLSLLLSSGHAVLHWPAAITWHTHRREMAALRKQFYGYSAGLSAFYASMIRTRPAAAFDVLRLAPYAFRDLRRGSENLRSGHLPDDFPPDLLKAARRGLFEGGIMYAYEAIRDRRQSAPAARRVL
jgi:glycosyltransferase involved in cell wall biosynthesis